MSSLSEPALQGEDVFPIPGTKRLKYLEENAAAFFVELTPEDKRFLEDTFHQDNVSAAVPHGGQAFGTRLAFPRSELAAAWSPDEAF